MKRKLLTVVGARPQFIKAGVISRLIRDRYHDSIVEIIIHTGQHYDDSMSQIFFDQLDLPHPKKNLETGSGSQGEQTGIMLPLLEREILENKPDMVMVYGDTNSTLAGALAAAKVHVPVVHVEAGLRSWNRRMPEEINRVITDHLSSLLFCPSDVAVNNLKREGIEKGVVKTGDVMYDSALYCLEKANQLLGGGFKNRLREFKVDKGNYFIATVHRAENTEDLNRLRSVFDAFESLPLRVIWPVHPRTRKILESHNIQLSENILSVEPFSYLEMLLFLKHCRMILTDSGGIQKEAMYLKVPCITLRDETEWLETVDLGWNIVTGINKAKILGALETHGKATPENFESVYGSGQSGLRMIENIISY